MRTVALLALAACGTDPRADVVLFSATGGFRHGDAIEAAHATLPGELASRGLTSRSTEDAVELEQLDGASVVVFLYTTGNDLVTPGGRAELEEFVARGGGWVGVHSAADTEYLWPFYQELVVAPFASHPAIQPATVVIEDAGHPATAEVPSPWPVTDEWYNYAVNPRGEGVQILATLDETTYTGGTMGADHPIAWAHERLGGRAFYTGMGHSGERWSEPAYVAHVVSGIAWAAGRD